MAFTTKTLPPPPAPQTLSLPERVAELRAALDAAIDQMAAEQAVPGVPLGVIRQTITRGSSCQCRSYLIATGALK
jgi:hypothetical protein